MAAGQADEPPQQVQQALDAVRAELGDPAGDTAAAGNAPEESGGGLAAAPN